MYSFQNILGLTYTWELNSTVTALWCSSGLLDVEVTERTTWGLHNADLVGLGVVSALHELLNPPFRHLADTYGLRRL